MKFTLPLFATLLSLAHLSLALPLPGSELESNRSAAAVAARALLDADITKADVGHNGDIVKVKPTHVSVAKKGEGLARVDTEGVKVDKGDIAPLGPTKVFVAQKGHGLADVHHDRITVGKDGSIAHIEKNDISLRKKGKSLVDAGKVQAHVLKGKSLE
ncbi:hypothetical protein FPV67DRAFT_998507 [Lyophyllum atratum]|nr:hypothetical protein FPV67DRAFT_998507 [Lyophyllum atratum]